MNLFKLGGFKWKINRGGVSDTPTFNPARKDQVMTAPMYFEHTKDIYRDRMNKDSRTLIQEAFASDPDVSASVNAYLTTSNTSPIIKVLDDDGNLDRDGYFIVQEILRRLTMAGDVKGFQFRQNFRAISADMRYMALLRGGIANELVFDRSLAPDNIRQVDLASIRWAEPLPGKYIPYQEIKAAAARISLDIPTFFVSFFRRDPTKIYTNSHFIAAINTIAARQQVINDLYRIFYITGFPRIDISVLENVVLNNAPADVRTNSDAQKLWLRQQLTDIAQQFGGLRSDQAFIHWDSVKAGVINDRNPGAGIDISKAVDVLNAQNQAALKTMATIIGRGEMGVNTASVEARIFCMNADELNEPVGEMWSRILSFALRVQGRASYVEVRFRPVELRPTLELEPQLTIRQSRLLQALSLGVISDDEFHSEMYGRHRPEWSPMLSGTGFMDQTKVSVDSANISPNGDPLGRGLAPAGSEAAKGNGVSGRSTN